MRKTKKTIGAAIAFASILLPMSCDNVAIAAIGVVMLFIGCYMAEAFCWQGGNDERK